MAQLINIDDVQSWFTENRLLLDADDLLTEETDVSNEVLSTVASRYDVSIWVSRATTPTLIRSVISARVAAIRYRKHYADQLDEEGNYALWLDNWFMTTLDGIVSGQIQLLDATDLDAALVNAGAEFFPTDQSSIDDPPFGPGQGPAAFSMGKVF